MEAAKRKFHHRNISKIGIQSNYGEKWAGNAGFIDIAEDIEKHYGISPGIQNCIDDLVKKTTRKRSYDHSL